MQNNNTAFTKLEFNTIREMLAQHALSERAKEKCLALAPELSEDNCRRKLEQTTGARNILDAQGNPPLTAMQDIEAILTLSKAGAMLVPDQLMLVEQFLVACARMQGYLAKAGDADEAIASYGGSFCPLPELSDEINRCIRAGQVDSAASAALAGLRRKTEHLASQVQSQLAGLAQSKRQWLSDGGAVQRNGRYVLPVRREHKSKISGAVVDMSGTGGTVFIEPASVARLQQQLADLRIEEENEVRKVLYTLSALVDENAAALHLNIEAMETLDFLFAKAKLSAALGAGPVSLTTRGSLRLVEARHPLLPKESCVPLTVSLGGDTRGIIITGPNTGGKTVTLKTIGLLSLMAQCGLHVTAAPESQVCMHADYLCDLGDGQSISENLSTFSSHMTTVIDILHKVDAESLVLLDELGSGTDPAEGMGIAVAVLEALRQTSCMLVATTHYPEVKQYASQAQGFVNARMAFDKESLQATYRLEVGQAGESCALYIARRLGLPEEILQRAEICARRAEAGPAGDALPLAATASPAAEPAVSPKGGRLQAAVAPREIPAHAAGFGYGDSVMVHPARETGIVFHTANDKGEVGVQVKGEKSWIPHKRLELITKAEMLYPPDYDFSVIFDTKQNRRARKQMDKGHNIKGNVIHHSEYEW